MRYKRAEQRGGSARFDGLGRVSASERRHRDQQGRRRLHRLPTRSGPRALSQSDRGAAPRALQRYDSRRRVARAVEGGLRSRRAADRRGVGVPREAVRRGTRPLNRTWSVHLLACRFDIRADCERLADALDHLLQRAHQRHPVSRCHRFDVRRSADGYRIEEDGLAQGIESTPQSACYVLTSRIHALALAALPEFTKVHAGCATWQGRRLLAVGPPEAGKTTLMTRLVYEGFAVHGDELVLLRNGEALPYPRRFGVRAPTLRLIPQLAASRPGTIGAGSVVTDPADLGFDWVIEPAPVAAVFYLVPNHGGQTSLEPCPKHIMAQRIMSQSTSPDGGRRQWIRDVCAILD